MKGSIITSLVLLMGVLSLGTLIAVTAMVTGPRVQVQGPRLPVYQDLAIARPPRR